MKFNDKSFLDRVYGLMKLAERRLTKYLTYRNGQKSAVQKDQKSRKTFEYFVLSDVEHEGTKFAILGPGWYVQRLSELYTTLEIEPTSLVYSQQGSTLSNLTFSVEF